MKLLSWILFCLSALVLGACGAPFESGEFTSVDTAGAAPSTGGSESVAGAIGVGHAGSSAVGTGGAGGSSNAAGAPATAGSSGNDDAAGAAGAAPSYDPPPCSSPKDVTGGYDGSLNTMPVCLRTKEPLNTIACSNWDNRTITVNSVPVTCGEPADIPQRADGYTYIELGGGTSSAATVRWFLTAPSPDACGSRHWVDGDLYAQGEIMLGVCSAPGSAKSCVLGTTYAFACSGLKCGSVQPGGNDWASTWMLLSSCG